MMTTYREIIDVTVDDDDTGIPVDIPVEVTYAIERDTNYGADADGRRGVLREEIHVLDSAIPHEHLKRLTFGQVQEIAHMVVSRLNKKGAA